MLRDVLSRESFYTLRKIVVFYRCVNVRPLCMPIACVYSAQVISPPRVGWEENAKAAFDAGAVDAITSVLEKHAADAEIYGFSINALTAMSSFPRYCAKMAETGHIHAILVGFRQYWEELVRGGSADSESAPVERTIGLMQNVLKLGPEAFVDSGGLSTLLMLVSTPPPAPAGGRKPASDPKLPQSPVVMSLASQCLERVSRSKIGQERLSTAESINTIVYVCGVKFAPPSAAKAGAGSAVVVDAANVNAHLDPAFRVLDRLSRTDRGLTTLRA